MESTNKEVVIIEKLIEALQAQQAILQGKKVYLKRLDRRYASKGEVTRIQVSNISMYSKKPGNAIIDVSFVEWMDSRLIVGDEIGKYVFIIKEEQ